MAETLGEGEPLSRAVTQFGSHWKRHWLSDGREAGQEWNHQEAAAVQVGRVSGAEQGGDMTERDGQVWGLLGRLEAPPLGQMEGCACFMIGTVSRRRKPRGREGDPY